MQSCRDIRHQDIEQHSTVLDTTKVLTESYVSGIRSILNRSVLEYAALSLLSSIVTCHSEGPTTLTQLHGLDSV